MMRENREVVVVLEMYVAVGDEEKRALLMKIYRPGRGADGGFVGESVLTLDGEVVFEKCGVGADSFGAMYEVLRESKVGLYGWLEERGYQVYFWDEGIVGFYMLPDLDVIFSDVF